MAEKGFRVSCPFCGTEDVAITLELIDVRKLFCSGCDEHFTAQQARDKLAAEVSRWDAVCRWIESAPDREK